MKVQIKKWFLEKNFTQNQIYAIRLADETVVEKETEKAVFVVFKSEFGNISSWIPKSCLLTEEDIEEMKQQEETRENDYMALVNYAKSKGIKGIRKGLKKVTIIKKLQENGFEVSQF